MSYMGGLNNLDGLDSLKVVQWSLSIKNCTQLNNLSGIENLSIVQGDLFFFEIIIWIH